MQSKTITLASAHAVRFRHKKSNTHTHTHTHMHIHMHMHIHIYMHIQTYTLYSTYTYTYAHTHTYTFTCTCTYKQIHVTYAHIYIIWLCTNTGGVLRRARPIRAWFVRRTLLNNMTLVNSELAQNLISELDLVATTFRHTNYGGLIWAAPIDVIPNHIRAYIHTATTTTTATIYTTNLARSSH